MAISKFKLHKKDGFLGSSSDHFMHDGNDLIVDTALLTSSYVPDQLCLSTVTQISKGTMLI